jgi:hypothetical protein
MILSQAVLSERGKSVKIQPGLGSSGESRLTSISYDFCVHAVGSGLRLSRSPDHRSGKCIG